MASIKPEHQAIIDAVQNLGGELADLTCRLVRVNTVNPYSGDESAHIETAGQELMAAELAAAGAAVQRVPVPADIYARCGVLGPKGRQWLGRDNVVGRFAFGRGGKSIILNTHIDTIGTHDYQGDPFEGVLRDGKIWGRGSSDSKGNLAIGLIAIKALQASGVKIDAQVIFESVVDEECNGVGAGTLACLAAGITADAAIALDGAGQRPYRSCHGIVTPEVRVAGRSGHTSGKAVNAIEKLLLIKAALDGLVAKRRDMNPPRRMTLGVIRGGTHPSVAPSDALMQYNIGYDMDEIDKDHPADAGRSLMQQFEAIVAEAAAKDEHLCVHRPTVTWLKNAPPFCVPPDVPLASCVQRAYEKVFGQERPMRPFSWGDASHFWNQAGMAVIGMGGGTDGTAHTTCEYIDAQLQLDSAKAVALAVYEFLRA